MMVDVLDKGILEEIADHPELLGVPLAVSPEDVSLIRSMLASDQLVYNMHRTGIVDLLAKFDSSTRSSLADVIGWDTPLLRKLAEDTNHLRVLHRMWDLVPDREGFIRKYLRLLALPEAAEVKMRDAFSKGQIDSKMWLIHEVKRLGLTLNNTWTLCGWVGTLAYLMSHHENDTGVWKIRSFDVDPNCAGLAEALNYHLLEDGWRFKAFTADVNSIDYDRFTWTFWSKVHDRMSKPIAEVPDTIINTSCDHMTDRKWYDAIPTGKLIILQNNNWVDNTQHTQTVGSIEEFKDLYPMKEYVYEGQLDCKIYTRFMLMGRK